jgi:putative transposase
LHSGIGFVTPESKHQNKDVEILKKRKEVYELAKKKKPLRWSGNTRKWEYVTSVN